MAKNKEETSTGQVVEPIIKPETDIVSELSKINKMLETVVARIEKIESSQPQPIPLTAEHFEPLREWKPEPDDAYVNHICKAKA